MREGNLLQLQRITKVYRKGLLRRGQTKTALRDLDLHIVTGETLGLVGESGCGKSTAGRIVLGLEKPSEGNIYFKGREVTHLKAGDIRNYRKAVQGVFQDPSGTLDPRMTIGRSLKEVVLAHFGRAEAQKTVEQLLEQVGLDRDIYNSYPFELSGGQKQRIGLARSLAVEPELLVCDEPVASLDISLQAQILKVFREFQVNKGLAYLFISHDLRVIRFISHRVAVMYKGTIIEEGPNEEVFSNPVHPYTKLLLAAMPRLGCGASANLDLPHDIKSGVVEGLVEGQGCPYARQCKEKADICNEKYPKRKEIAPGHWVRCHL